MKTTSDVAREQLTFTVNQNVQLLTGTPSVADLVE